MSSQIISNTALRASPFCLGTGNWSARDKAERVYQTFRAAGGNFFDCAHIYACWRNELGLPERLLGEFICGANRDDLVIATKGGHPAFKDYPRPDAYLSRQTIRGDVDDCRERLGIDQIDVFYLHRDDMRMGVEEIIDVLAEEVGRGAVKHIGASNWTTKRIEAANQYAKRAGKPAFVLNQPMWNLGSIDGSGGDSTMASLNDRADDIGYHEKSGLAVACYTSTAQGYFADNGRVPKRYDNQISRARLARCRELATKLGATPGQVALAWLMSHPFQVFPILGTTDVAHLRDSLGADGIKFDEATRIWIGQG